MRPDESTRALIVGLFVVSEQPSLSAPEIIALTASTGVLSSNVKSHLTRMVADGTLVRTGALRSYRYSPSRVRSRVIETIRSRIASRSEPWDGTWIVFVPGRATDRAARERIQRRLRFYGFRPLARGAFARPAWPSTWVREKVARLLADAGGARVIGALGGERAVRDIVRSYRLQLIDRRARRLLGSIKRILVAPPIGERAFALRLELGEPVARLFSDDPYLPAEMWGGLTALDELATAYRKLDSILERGGRSFLAGVLREPARAAHIA
jgi:phenylacetic acid degradation operon negative regulatory protein